MLAKIYQNNILGNPKSVLLILVSILFLSIYFSKDFRLDASSETLLLDGDPDLKYLNEINERYKLKVLQLPCNYTLSTCKLLNQHPKLQFLQMLLGKCFAC